MSEPMGCDRFCQDTNIPCLETVSEEARRQTGTYLHILTHQRF